MARWRRSWVAGVAGIVLLVAIVSGALAAGAAAPGRLVELGIDAVPHVIDVLGNRTGGNGADKKADSNDVDSDDEDGTDADVQGGPPDGTHGACVSAIARSDAVGGPNENHGGAVSQAARSDCRDGTDAAPAGQPPEGFDACVAAVAASDAVGGKNDNHGGAVSEAARFTCRGLAIPEASKGGRPAWAGAGGGPKDRPAAGGQGSGGDR